MPNLKNRRGQGLVEYIILITLMGIALIVTLQKLGSSTKEKFSEAAQEIRDL
jgi:Flp pilus assembly pilin Flp